MKKSLAMAIVTATVTVKALELRGRPQRGASPDARPMYVHSYPGPIESYEKQQGPTGYG